MPVGRSSSDSQTRRTTPIRNLLPISPSDSSPLSPFSSPKNSTTNFNFSEPQTEQLTHTQNFFLQVAPSVLGASSFGLYYICFGDLPSYHCVLVLALIGILVGEWVRKTFEI